MYFRDRHIHRDEGNLTIFSRGDARIEKAASRSGLSIGEGLWGVLRRGVYDSISSSLIINGSINGFLCV